MTIRLAALVAVCVGRGPARLMTFQQGGQRLQKQILMEINTMDSRAKNDGWCRRVMVTGFWQK
jgi:hypothetical protein